MAKYRYDPSDTAEMRAFKAKRALSSHRGRESVNKHVRNRCVRCRDLYSAGWLSDDGLCLHCENDLVDAGPEEQRRYGGKRRYNRYGN